MSEHTDLNAQIAERLFGWTFTKCQKWCCKPYSGPNWHDDEGSYRAHLPAYTTDPAATALVWGWLETLYGLEDIRFSYTGPHHVWCTIILRNWPYFNYHGETHQKALCRSALVAKSALGSEEK